MRTELAVIGAGPAGLTAAVAAAEAGVRVTLIDEQVEPGGQIWRQPPRGVTPPAPLRLPEEARNMLSKADRLENLTQLKGTLVWGRFSDGVLGLWKDGEVLRLHSERIVVATGAYDLPVAFPGWTLPGVLTAGGIQAFLKSQLIVPGRRILLAGSHPLLLVVAAQLVAAGSELAGVAFAQRPEPGFLQQHGSDVWRQRRQWGEGLAAWRTLRRARVPLWFGKMIARAEGEGSVSSGVLVDVDEQWYPVEGTEQRVEADTIAVGYGFVPATEFTRQAGCQHEWDAAAGHWVCVQGDDMGTSEPDVYVAGEAAGIAGASVAQLEGRMAGLRAAVDLGRLHASDIKGEWQHLSRKRRQGREAAKALQRLSAPRKGLYSLISDDTIVCRCEELKGGHLRGLLQEHRHLETSNALKLVSRAGMGACQGRYCHASVARLLADSRDTLPEAAGQFTVRTPIKPLPLQALAKLRTPSPKS